MPKDWIFFLIRSRASCSVVDAVEIEKGTKREKFDKLRFKSEEDTLEII